MTQSDDLKSVVRNWITSRIYATNDVYMPSNDYIKFDKTEEHNSGVYSTVLKDSDKTGRIEFIDVLDEDETEPDKEIKVVGMNMFNDAIEQLEEDVANTYSKDEIGDLADYIHCDFEKVKLTKQEIQLNENRIRLTLDEVNEDSYTFDVKGNFHRIISHTGEVLKLNENIHIASTLDDIEITSSVNRNTIHFESDEFNKIITNITKTAAINSL